MPPSYIPPYYINECRRPPLKIRRCGPDRMCASRPVRLPHLWWYSGGFIGAIIETTDSYTKRKKHSSQLGQTTWCGKNAWTASSNVVPISQLFPHTRNVLLHCFRLLVHNRTIIHTDLSPHGIATLQHNGLNWQHCTISKWSLYRTFTVFILPTVLYNGRLKLVCVPLYTSIAHSALQ